MTLISTSRPAPGFQSLPGLRTRQAVKVRLESKATGRRGPCAHCSENDRIEYPECIPRSSTRRLRLLLSGLHRGSLIVLLARLLELLRQVGSPSGGQCNRLARTHPVRGWPDMTAPAHLLA